MQKKLSNAELIKSLYNSLKDVQKQMYRLFLSPTNGRKYVVHCARRLGKSYLLCVLAVTIALSKPNAQIRYASVTKLSVRKMIKPIMKQIFADYQELNRPIWSSQEGAYIFDNGSMIHVAGVNKGNADSLRGTAAELCIVDEAAFVDELSYLVDSVLMPQLISTGGKLIMASSSPLSPAHEFTSYIQDAKLNGYYSAFDIYLGGYDSTIVEEFCKEAGGSSSTAWRREYLNELIVDTELSVVPEWKPSFVQVVPRDEFYSYFHKYEAADWGVRDNTVVLFAYYDFIKATLVVEHEFVTNGPESTTRFISEAIESREAELEWKAEPYLRVADSNELRTIQDLGSEFSKHFSPVQKAPGSKNQMINAVRLLVQDGRILVHPRCKNLIGCLEFGVFSDKKRSDFGRARDLGHYDALDALLYLVSVIDQTTNPIPIAHNTSFNHYVPQDEETNQTIRELKKLFA